MAAKPANRNRMLLKQRRWWLLSRVWWLVGGVAVILALWRLG